MSLLDVDLAEVISQEGLRYVLRCNPVRAREIASSRKDKLLSLEKTVNQYNQYLKEHPRAKAEVGKRILQEKAQSLRIYVWSIFMLPLTYILILATLLQELGAYWKSKEKKNPS